MSLERQNRRQYYRENYDYHITVNYILELTKRTHNLFKSSEVEERRQLIKLVLSNLRVEDEKVQFEAIKPFDTILNYTDRQAWLPKPRLNINFGFDNIIQVFQNTSFMGELRERWELIKKLNKQSRLALSI